MVHKTRTFDFITLQFNVDCKTKFGENVYICGSCEELGYWNPHRALKLETNRRNYPEWSTNCPLFMRPNQMIEFKVCIVKENIVVWESFLQNRVFFIGSKPLKIFVNFNSLFMEVHEKRIIDMECRDQIQSVIGDMESQWGSSIRFPSNYPLEKFHMLQRGHNTLSGSQISSNLMSVCGSDQLQLQIKIMKFLNPSGLHKTMSRPNENEPRTELKKKHMISQTNKIISLHSDTNNFSPGKRTFRSLPKKQINKYQNAIFQQKLPNKYSFPVSGQEHYSKQTNKATTNNTETLRSQKKLIFERKNMESSLISKGSNDSYQNLSQSDSIDDLFGFEYF